MLPCEHNQWERWILLQCLLLLLLVSTLSFTQYSPFRRNDIDRPVVMEEEKRKQKEPPKPANDDGETFVL